MQSIYSSLSWSSLRSRSIITKGSDGPQNNDDGKDHAAEAGDQPAPAVPAAPKSKSSSKGKSKPKPSPPNTASPAESLRRALAEVSGSTIEESESTEYAFQAGNPVDIIAVGLQEHWVIDQKDIALDGKVIGTGSFGEVRGGILHGSAPIVVKLPRDTGYLQKTICMMANEIRLHRRLRHPNIVLFHGVMACGLAGQPVFGLILEYIDGGDMSALIRRRVAQNRTDMIPEVGLLLDAARGMKYLHAQKPIILHRDLKPSNILVENTEPLRAKLADFGISVALAGGTSRGVAGTANYMAPEVKCREAYTGSADVFSYGCTAFFAVTAEHPQPRSVQNLAKLLGQDKTLLSGTASGTLELLADCVAMSPDSRPTFSTVYQSILQSHKQVEAMEKSRESRETSQEVLTDSSVQSIVEELRAFDSKPCTERKVSNGSSTTLGSTNSTVNFSRDTSNGQPSSNRIRRPHKVLMSL